MTKKEEHPATIPYGGQEIWNPETVGFVERDDFIRSLAATSAVVEAVPLEQSILAKWKRQLAQPGALKAAQLEVSPAIARMARDYARYTKGGARLPKFSRWASSMFPNDKELGNTLAKLGQVKAEAGKIVFSAECYDLMRAGVTPHFGSCFRVASVGGESLRAIATAATGIGIAFVDDEKGLMRGRTWLYHAKRVKDGADVVVFASYPYGKFDEAAAAKALKDRGFLVYKATYTYGKAPAGTTPIKYQNMGPQFYNDTNLWNDNSAATAL